MCFLCKDYELLLRSVNSPNPQKDTEDVIKAPALNRQVRKQEHLHILGIKIKDFTARKAKMNINL